MVHPRTYSRSVVQRLNMYAIYLRFGEDKQSPSVLTIPMEVNVQKRKAHMANTLIGDIS